MEEGTGSDWGTQDRLPIDGDNGAGRWMRSSPGGRGGGSAFQAEETAQKQADPESAWHAAG